MSSEGPSDNVSNASIRLYNLRLNHDESDEAAGGAEAENAEAFIDSPQNMQPPGNIMLNRARRALTFVCDEEQASISARCGEPSTSNCDK
jgi:BTB/POZ domain-containing protein 1/2